MRQDDGKVALQRGPVLYCIEECDNGPDLAALRLPPIAEFSLKDAPQEIGGVPMLVAPAIRRDTTGWENKLYSTEPPKYTATTLTAVPYYLWANRAPGEMTVWINE